MDIKTPAPQLTLCANSKEPIQAALALVNYLAAQPSSADTGLPVELNWTTDANSPITLNLKPGGEKKIGLEAVMKQLSDMYANLGVSGKDREGSKEVSM